MADFNQRGQKVDKQYNAETINFNNEGEHSSDTQKTYLINCVHCGQILEAVSPFIDKAPKRLHVYDSWPTSSQGWTSTQMACLHCKGKLILYWMNPSFP